MLAGKGLLRNSSLVRLIPSAAPLVNGGSPSRRSVHSSSCRNAAKISSVSVIGSGLMGGGIAQVSAHALKYFIGVDKK